MTDMSVTEDKSPRLTIASELPTNGGLAAAMKYKHGMLVCGGCGGPDCNVHNATNVCHFLAPESTPHPMPSMLKTRDYAAGTLCRGRPFIVGGRTAGPTTEYLDADGQWHYGPPLDHSLSKHCMVTLDDDETQHLVTGGFSGEFQDRTFVNDWNLPELGWLDFGRLTVARAGLACTKIELVDGPRHVLAAGGADVSMASGGGAVDIFDITTRTW